MPTSSTPIMQNGSVKLLEVFGGSNPHNVEEFFLEASVEYHGAPLSVTLTGRQGTLDFVGLFYDGQAKGYNVEWERNGKSSVKVRDFGDVLPEEYAFLRKIRRALVRHSKRPFS
ncbi:MAG TPA: hypothetical protein PKM84_01185 [Candidatus Pacearchaeota archaeon]|nr:hypothetical protein [Candidatus Pacearchaeota archaeon]